MTKNLDKLLAGTDPKERTLVEAWLDGELAEEDRREVEAWLLKDPAWKERLPTLIRGHRRLQRMLDQQSSWPMTEPLASMARTPPRAGAQRRNSSERLETVFIRRANANQLFEEARQLAAAGSPEPALRCVAQVFDLSDPLSLLGKDRLRELMELAASCETARGDQPAAAVWTRRAERL